MAVKVLSEIDVQIQQQKTLLQQLSIKIRTFMSTHKTLPPKEKAKLLKEIQSSIEAQRRYLDKTSTTTLQNTGSRFALENLKQSFLTLQSSWRKFDSSLNQAS